MKRRLRTLFTIGGIIVSLAVALSCTWLWVSRQPLPRTRGRTTLEGLGAPVEIFRDRYGVPHIYARAAKDLFFAQGYVHAQDRFWQMEFWRRLGAGRLSELFGKDLLETDKFLRTMGFYEAAEQQYEGYDAETREYLEAYADGVNAYILNRRPCRLGLEFFLLKVQGVDFQIEPWQPADTVSWGKMMCYDLGSNYTLERLNLEVLRAAGRGKWSDFFSPYRKDMPVIISDQELLRSGFQLADGGGEPLRVFGSSGVGSNNWVISGSRTASGRPILANDMHLALQMPSIWYEVGLHGIDDQGNAGRTAACPFHLRGFSFPGVPGVIAGHNDRIAWGHTNLPGDVQDLYIERLNPENPDQYEVNGRWVDMEIRHETIQIHKEDEPYVLRVRHTRHGPILTDLQSWEKLGTYFMLPGETQGFPENMGFTALSLRWTALEPGQLHRAVFMLDKAGNWEEFREALRYWDVPAQNIVYADVEGNIGYQVPGLHPIRAKGHGLAPVPGWTDEYEWRGYVPYEQLPFLFNPEKGYIVSANNPVTTPNFPLPEGSEFAYGYRARRIAEMIEGFDRGITAEQIAEIHGDTFDLSASEIIPYLEGLDLRGEPEQPPEEESDRARRKREKRLAEELEALERARKLLLDWDNRLEMDSSEAVLFGYFYIKLVEETFKDQYPESSWPPGIGGRTQNAFYYLLPDPQNVWWDDIRTPDKRESRDEILVRSLRKGYRAAAEELGDRIDAWRWGDVHTAVFRNQTFGASGIGPIERIFNRGPVEVRGGNIQVSVAKWDMEEPFEIYHIASQRAIYDLGDLSKTLLIHPTGQSGHPAHRHYDDFIEPWRKIEYHPGLWDLSSVEEASRRPLVLEPKD
ncbi:MAG: penicillin acylase family protein [Spirochaetales bacterium]|nr:penicillin acylase family protein [Spirochaetales bacterium]